MELRREFKITLEMGAVENIGLEPNTLKGMLNKTLLEMLERSVGECAIGTIGIIVGEDMISISISNGTYITSYTNRELYEKILNIIREYLSGGKK